MNPRAAACFGALLAACSGGPEPIPLRGPVPTRIVVLPVTVDGVSPALRDALDLTAQALIVDRGYATVPPEVVTVALRDSSDAQAAAWRTLCADFGADAVLERRAVAMTPLTQDDAPGRVDVTWRLFGADSPVPIWEAEAAVRPGGVVSEHLTGPQGMPGRDPFLSDEPIHGRALGSFRTEVRANTPLEMAEDVQRRLAQRLPFAPAR